MVARLRIGKGPCIRRREAGQQLLCRCGILIGKGVEPKEAVKEIGAVVEGYYAAVTARTLAQKVGIEMPIAQAAYEVLYEGRDVHAVVTELMSRAKRSETEESSWT